MRVLSASRSRGDVALVLGLAVRLRSLGAQVICAPPCFAEPPRRLAGLAAAQFDTVAAGAQGCEALLATGATTAGVRL